MYGKLLKEIEMNLKGISEFQISYTPDVLTRIWKFQDTPKTRNIMKFIISLAGLKVREFGVSMGECGPNREAINRLGNIEVSIFWANNNTPFFSVQFRLMNGRVHESASLVVHNR